MEYGTTHRGSEIYGDENAYRNFGGISFVWSLGLVLSFSKKNKLPTLDAYSRADELKVIIYNNDDFRFAEQQAKKVKENCLLYLQPEWGKRDKVMPLIVEYVLQNPSWKASLQTHKYLNIP